MSLCQQSRIAQRIGLAATSQHLSHYCRITAAHIFYPTRRTFQKNNDIEDMEVHQKENEQVEDEEEYVFLDLSGVCGQTDIPANTPYVLSGLDTENPILVIGNDLKLIGEYQETIGTCFVFSETVDNAPVVHEETEPSDKNLFMGKCVVDPNQAPTKQVKPIARLQKILKFRLLPDDNSQSAATKMSASIK